jgi:hypothetical protein
MRDLKKELLLIKGGDFPKWYASLSKLEKIEYGLMLEEMSKNYRSS